MQGVIHSILAGSNIGILVLATGAFFFRLLLWNREGKIADYADKVAFVAAGAGLTLAVLSGLSGYFLTWSPEAVGSMLLTQNKILVTVALLMSWGMFVVIRWRAGDNLWKSTPLKLWTALLVLFGFINTVLVGSMGGSAALIGTALDPALIALNINRYISLSWGVGLSIVLIVLSLGVAAFSAYKTRQSR